MINIICQYRLLQNVGGVSVFVFYITSCVFGDKIINTDAAQFYAKTHAILCRLWSFVQVTACRMNGFNNIDNISMLEQVRMAAYSRNAIQSLHSKPFETLTQRFVGPPSARRRNAIQMAFRWRANRCLASCLFTPFLSSLLFFEGNIFTMYTWMYEIPDSDTNQSGSGCEPSFC